MAQEPSAAESSADLDVSWDVGAATAVAEELEGLKTLVDRLALQLADSKVAKGLLEEISLRLESLRKRFR